MTTPELVKRSYNTLWECEEMITTLRHQTGLSQYELMPQGMYFTLARAWSLHRRGESTNAIETATPVHDTLTGMIARYAVKA